MNGELKKELKKFDQEYSFLKTVHLGRYVRNFSEQNASEEMSKKTVRFSLNEKSSDWCDGKNSIREQLLMFIDRIRVKLLYLKFILSDWIFLAILGILVAFISISVDMMIYYCQEVQSMTTHLDIPYQTNLPLWMWTLSLLCWTGYTMGMVAASASFVHFISPQAIGSGIPEMKTIIRGVILKDYLTFRTLVSKIFGVAMSLGSGVPIGKMGPFVHIASVVANQMSRLASRFDPAFGSETRRVECLAAACAVGVACTFSAPVGGVLFSIEVTTMYFSVRSYWRGFFAACCGATTIRLLRGFVAETEVTVNAFFQTSFAPDAFSVQELPLFVILGIICGILGATYISLYRSVVLFLRNNAYAKSIFQRHWIVYPLFVSFVFSIVSYPHGLGTFSTGRLKFGRNLKDFFSNCTFNVAPDSSLACGSEIFEHWVLNRGNVLTLLVLFIAVHFVFSIFCITLPVPSGIFMPVFVLGAAIGRLMGELLVVTLPEKITQGVNIYPGVYAVVGAASFSASVTHTVSVSVMIFEITGQLHYILPVMISVVISNAVCAYLQPSFFDTIIKIKHLPFLPDIPPTTNTVHTTCAENIMVSPVLFLTRVTNYAEIKKILLDGRNLRIFPVVDSLATQMLIGTVSRRFLLELLEKQVGDIARHKEAERRVRKAIETIDIHFKTTQNEITENKRTKSESNISPIKSGKRRESKHSSTTGDLEHSSSRRESRFLVVPSQENYLVKIIPPPPVTRRNAFCSVIQNERMKSPEKDHDSTISSLGENDNNENVTIHGNTSDYHTLIKSYMRQAKKYLHHMQFGHNKKEEQPSNMYDLSSAEKDEWETERLNEEIDLTEDIDPAPFQLVKNTSLFKIHSIFSMLQLSKVYVTDCGRLVGVVALSDVRKELERSQEHQISSNSNSVSVTESNTVKTNEANLLKKSSSSKIVDILTPPLEVIKSTTLALTSEKVTDNETTTSHSDDRHLINIQRKSSSLRLPAHKISHDLSIFKQERHRGSLDGSHHEQLVEAVAYLRRKSLVIPERNV